MDWGDMFGRAFLGAAMLVTVAILVFVIRRRIDGGPWRP